MRFLVLLIVPALLTAAPPALAAGPESAPRNDSGIEGSVDAYLRPYLDLRVFQGVVLIGRGDQVLFEKAYGLANVELAVRNTPRQVFRIASITKLFTEVALGRLMEEKRLDLSDPLSRYVPGFPRGEEITLEMLRTHRSGIANMNSIPYDEEARAPHTLDSLVRVLATAPLTSDPGSRPRYSNGGYALLGYVIEKASGRGYADYLQRAVLGPLGLRHTRHEADGMVIVDRAYGYTVSPDEPDAIVVAPFQEMVTKTGGGSMVSTAQDLHRFLRAMYQDNVVSAQTWRRLFPPDSVFEYQGRCPGFNVYVGRDFAHDVDVVVLANNYAAGMVGTIGNDFLALARGKKATTPPWRAGVVVDSTRVKSYAGVYRAPHEALPYGDGPFTLKWRLGALMLEVDHAPADVLVPQGDDRFLLRNLWSEMRFVDGPSGQGRRPTLRPLWFKTDPVPLERVEDRAK